MPHPRPVPSTGIRGPELTRGPLGRALTVLGPWTPEPQDRLSPEPRARGPVCRGAGLNQTLLGTGAQAGPHQGHRENPGGRCTANSQPRGRHSWRPKEEGEGWGGGWGRGQHRPSPAFGEAHAGGPGKDTAIQAGWAQPAGAGD